MHFWKQENALMIKREYETIKIEAWGKNALRVRSTKNAEISDINWGLLDTDSKDAKITIDEKKGEAFVENGKIKLWINPAGILSFYNEDKLVLREYFRTYGPALTKESKCLKVINREYVPVKGSYSFGLNIRFESNDEEKIYGMGQYQHAYLDQKGCVLELAQRNSQVSIPFLISSLNYGFLWNNPAVGRATFGKNYTEWHVDSTPQMDYWVTVDENPKKIIENYTEVTGRAPAMPDELLGLWQCKLRYRTQDEVLSVARKYKELGIKLDVIVIDFFHWPRQGDWCFDKKYWPDPKAMVDELHEMGTKVMVSVWPSVDRKSSNFYKLNDRGLLVQTERGSIQTYDFQGDCLTLDATNPLAQEFVWEKCNENYRKYGIDMFWLDNSEPDYAIYDYENYRYHLGPALQVSNIYPKLYTKAFYDGLKKENAPWILNLVRSAWIGSQNYATLLWSGDVQSTFESLKDQIVAGLNAGIAGIPWWTTDIGGFMEGDVNDPDFKQLLLRWFEFAVFSPVLRLHGDRDPHNIPPLDTEHDFGGGYLYTGQPTEMYAYGDEAFKIMKQNLDLRESLKGYISSLYAEASENGSPLMRTMFYEFPEDKNCWNIEDQYMFGAKYLVAPIVKLNQFERDVYLPEGIWKSLLDGTVINAGKGGMTVLAAAPLEAIPVFERL
ncbi:MAG: family 31 glucosidase [Lachnospiraceae bacterium]|nr:family 31 glucosidase [Lachnospiraceae bacterium]